MARIKKGKMHKKSIHSLNVIQPDAAGIDPAVKVTLTKNIPVGAGLGGGSSDAAAALMGLNNFTKAGLNDTELIKMAELLGSDVPFFLGPPLAVCTGRGEKIEKIESRRHISYIWIARDNRVMIDDAIVEVKDVSKVMYKKRIDDPQIIVSLKIDKDTEMERVIEVQEELRLADATRINYATDFKAT